MKKLSILNPLSFRLFKSHLFVWIISFVSIFLLAAFGLFWIIRGDAEGQKLKYQNSYDTSVGSPFESSNSTSRYVLTEAIVDDHTFELSEDRARVASPDLVKYKNKYLSIFTPGVSLLGTPFYLLGKHFGIPQLLTYLLTSVVACLNVIVIAKLSRLLGADRITAVISGLVFLFATDALAYSQTYTQHHFTVLLLVTEIILSTAQQNVFTNFLSGSVYGYGVLVDIPNAFLLFPAFVRIAWNHIRVHTAPKVTKVQVKMIGLILLLGVIPSGRPAR